MKIALAALAALVSAAVAAVAAASVAWSRRTRQAAGRLHDGAAGAPLAAAATRDADPLPPPVERFLARTLPADGRTVRFARLRQEGEFLLREPDGWAPFTATQRFRAHPPGFVWDARIRMAPFLFVHVRDSYMDGTGSMHGAVAGLVTVTRAAGTPEMATGSLYRYLAESAWLPTRLRPSTSLRWDPVDDRTALATLTDGATGVSVRFRFNEAGDIVGTHVPARAREVDGSYVPTPWTGRFGDHRELGGLRIPAWAEVAWIVDGEERPYWRGRIIAADYELA